MSRFAPRGAGLILMETLPAPVVNLNISGHFGRNQTEDVELLPLKPLLWRCIAVVSAISGIYCFIIAIVFIIISPLISPCSMRNAFVVSTPNRRPYACPRSSFEWMSRRDSNQIMSDSCEAAGNTFIVAAETGSENPSRLISLSSQESADISNASNA